MDGLNLSLFGNFSDQFNHTMSLFNRDFFETLTKVAISISILITIAILVTNILILVTVLTSSKLRNDVRYMLVVSLSLADLLTGVLGLPFFVDFGVQQKITVSCHFHVVIQVILFHAHVMITCVGLLMINIHYVIKQYNLRWFDIKNQYELPRNIVVAIIPWFLTLVIVSPMIVTGLHPLAAEIWSENRCPLFLYEWTLVTMLVINFYLPMALVFVCTGFIVKGWIESRKGNLAFRPTLLSEDTNDLHPKYLIILNVVCFLLLLPVHVINDYSQIEDIKLLLVLLLATFQLSLIKAVFFPSLWLFTPEVKQQLKEKVTLIFNRKLKSPQYVVNKSYKDFTEEENKN